MRISLVGGAGFIGHHLALTLWARGHEVSIVDSLMINNLYTIREPSIYNDFLQERLDFLEHARIPLLRMDARDYHLLSHALGALKPDVIVHLAAIAHIDRANKAPHETFDNSLRTLENALDVARALKCRLVFFSSSTVYGDFSQSVIDETEPLTPKGIYGNLKLAGERMCTGYEQAHGLPVAIVRPQALYGPRCISGRVTQAFIENALLGKPLEIHGNPAKKHDFTCIDDLIQGVRLIIENELTGAYNVTGEASVSLEDLAKIVLDRFGGEVVFKDHDDKPLRGTMSCRKLRDATGYTPRYDVKTGMNLYMDWYDARKDKIQEAG